MYYATAHTPRSNEVARKTLPIRQTDTCLNSSTMERKLKHSHTFTVESGDYRMVFSCATPQELQKWVSILQTAAAANDESAKKRLSLRNQRYEEVEESMSNLENSPVDSEKFVREAFRSYVQVHTRASHTYDPGLGSQNSSLGNRLHSTMTQGSGDMALRISDLHEMFRHLGHLYSARQLEVRLYIQNGVPLAASSMRAEPCSSVGNRKSARSSQDAIYFGRSFRRVVD